MITHTINSLTETRMFKLIRVDSSEPSKILLTSGSHLFGRGRFLDVDGTELRISKTHGRFEVSEDVVTIISMHQNPCFIKKKDSEEKLILTKDISATVHHGDKVGLLPESYWYELVHLPREFESAATDSETNIEPQQSNCMNNTSSVEKMAAIQAEVGKPVESDEDQNTQAPDSQSLLDGGGIQTEEVEKPVDISSNEEQNIQAANFQSLLDTGNQNQEPSTEEYPALQEIHNLKRTHSQSELNSGESPVKVKVESNDALPGTSGQNNNIPTSNNAVIKADPESVKNEPSDKDNSPSNINNGAPNADGGPPMPAAVPQANLLKERCMYGANCYRRNPQHKAQFCHPADPEWGQGDRGVCPWGAGCRKRDPRHWRDHTHPPGVQFQPAQPAQHNRPPRGNAGRRVVYKNGNIFYINAQSVNFYDDHFNVEDSDGDSVDFDYEF